MFKRQLIKEIGLFDHVNFPSGYGEVAAGDACFMLNDLYGGEGITPTPTVSSSLTVASASCLQILIGIVVIALAK